jgi:hypothetical protein
MQLFVLLSPLLEGKNSGSKATKLANHPFIHNFLTTSGIEGLLKTSVGSFGESTSALHRALTNKDSKPKIGEKIINGKECLAQAIAALDFFCWLIRNKILNPLALFQNTIPAAARSGSSASSQNVSFQEFVAAISDFISACSVQTSAELQSNRSNSRMVLEDNTEDCTRSANSEQTQELRAELLLCIVYFIRNCMEYFDGGANRNSGEVQSVGEFLQRCGIWGPELKTVLVAVLLRPRLSNELSATDGTESLAESCLVPPYDGSDIMNGFIPHAVQRTWRYFNLADNGCDSKESFTNQIMQTFSKLCREITINAAPSAALCTHFCSVCLLVYESADCFDHMKDSVLDLLRSTVYNLLGRISQELDASPGNAPAIREFGDKTIRLACSIGEPLWVESNVAVNQSLLTYILSATMLAEGFDRVVIDEFLKREYAVISSQVSGLLREWSRSQRPSNTTSSSSFSSSSASASMDIDNSERLETFTQKLLAALCEKLAHASANDVPPDFAANILNNLDPSSVHLLTPELNSILLELESYVPIHNRTSLANELSSSARATCLAIFQSPRSSKQDLLRCLGLVPNLVAGCACTSPRPISGGFSDDPSTTQNVSIQEYFASSLTLRIVLAGTVGECLGRDGRRKVPS